MQYFPDKNLDQEVSEIVSRLNLTHISLERTKCVKSLGSKSRYTLARIHTLSKIFQKTFNQRPFYIIEVISENFSKLSEEEKTKTLIHELLHIPRSFGGGFRHHRTHVNKRAVEKAYREFIKSSFKKI